MNVLPIETLVPDKRGGAFMRQALQYRVYGSFREAYCLKGAWDDLAGRVGDILCSFDWCETWWQFFGKGRRLAIHTLRDGPRLVAVLPLFYETIRPGGVWLRTVRVLGCDYTIETASMAIEPAYARRFMKMLLTNLCRDTNWDILQMAPLRPYHRPAVDAMIERSLRDPRTQAVLVGRQDTWCTLFELPETYDEYLRTLSSNDRCNLLRRQRRLRQEHDVQFVEARTPQEMQEVMDALVCWHQTLWTSKGKPGQFGGAPAVEQFHRAVISRLARANRLALIGLKVDGQLLGADYGCFFGSRMHGLFRGYCRDKQWQSYGLGVLLHAQMVRLAIDQGAKVIDAGRGIFDYKLRLGGKLYGQHSLVVVQAGRWTRLRFWAALRTAYLVHVLYSRIWLDMIAPSLGIRSRGAHFHVRYSMLAQLYRRVRFRLFGGTKVHKISCFESAPPGTTIYS